MCSVFVSEKKGTSNVSLYNSQRLALQQRRQMFTARYGLGLENGLSFVLKLVDIDVFANCNWVDTRWQWYSTHLHTNNA
jgi:hypothetical protein